MDIEQLQKENDELKERLEAKHSEAQVWANEAMKKDIEINYLKAHIERLREALEFACAEDMWISNGEYNELFDYRYCDWYQDIGREVLNETPSQSLNHIKAQVEEETIQADIEFLDDMACEHSGNLNNRPRKYKEQSNGL